MNKKRKNFVSSLIYALYFVIATTAIIVLGVADFIFNYSDPATRIITIQDKYVKEGLYFVADTEGNTYIIEDLVFTWKWNSSDLYNGMQIGNTYQVKTTGKRVRLFNNYPNINEFELLLKE